MADEHHTCDPSNPDCAAYLFYQDPANWQPAEGATGRRRGIYRVPKGALDRHVPIRFERRVIDQVKEVAERDGLTVSSWIRRLVERELENHQPPDGPGTRNAGHATARTAWETT